MKKAESQINANQPLDTVNYIAITSQAESTEANDRKILLSHLQAGEHLPTQYCREALGVMQPGGRIMELRRQAYNLVTHWAVKPDGTGRLHKQAEYVLLSGEAK